MMQRCACPVLPQPNGRSEPEPLGLWLYTSRSALIDDNTDGIGSIVAAARRRNAVLGVTGALIATGRFFAQYLEGPPQSIFILREAIACDPRHRSLHTLDEGLRTGRRFSDWSLAYSGEAQPFDELVALAYRSGRDTGEILVMEMIRRFAADAPRPAAR